MKRRRVRYSFRADDDFMRIWAYIAQFSEDRADRFTLKLRERCLALGKMAGLGRPYPRRPGTRVYSTMKHLVFYRVHNDEIEITHVIHGARDIEEALDRLD